MNDDAKITIETRYYFDANGLCRRVVNLLGSHVLSDIETDAGPRILPTKDKQHADNQR